MINPITLKDTREAGFYDSNYAFRLSDVVSAMTYALDLTEGQPEGHAMRSCIIGMRIGEQLGLSAQQRSDLYYTLLLKDLGCSSNASKMSHLFAADDRKIKRAVKNVNLDNFIEGARFIATNIGSEVPFAKRLKHLIELGLDKGNEQQELVQTRCERGADIAQQMGFSKETAIAIRALDEHWNGKGHPYSLEAEKIPLLSRILCLSQTVEVFFQTEGPDAAIAVAKNRSGTWFDPNIVEAFQQAAKNPLFWLQLDDGQIEQRVKKLEPSEAILKTNDEQLDRIAEAFGRVIDAKSPWTFKHSLRVKQFAIGTALHLTEQDALSAENLKRLSRAALLHDIGKLGVSNRILDKQDKLSDQEFTAIRAHPAYSESILLRVKPFKNLAQLAGGHHERMDGKGYHAAIPASTLEFEVRLLSVADQFEALTAARPYREGMTAEAALNVLTQNAGDGVDPKALKALEFFLNTSEASALLTPQTFDPKVPICT